MSFWSLYMVKFSLSLSVIWLFYQLLLRKLTFYHWNRFYLLIYLLISFLVPLINIQPVLERQQLSHSVMIHYVPVIEQYVTVSNLPNSTSSIAATHFSAFAFFTIIMATGTVFFILRLCVRFMSLRKLTANAMQVSEGYPTIYHVDIDDVPFSFGSAIYINPNRYNVRELEEILLHEYVHVKQKHSVDILLAEFVCCINWYNPFAWLLRRAIRQNLEFIADDLVLQKGLDRQTYQWLLVKVSGSTPYPFTNSFSFLSLKRRIMMMNAIRTTKRQLLRFLFLVPLFGVLLLAFRSIGAQKHWETDLHPRSIAGSEGSEGILVPTGKSFQPVYSMTKKGDDSSHHGSDQSVGQKNMTVDRAPGDTIPTIDASLYGPGNPNVLLKLPRPEPLVILDEQEMPEGTIDSLNRLINPNDIESIQILKDSTAVKRYGIRAQGGVIIINSKKKIILDASSGTSHQATEPEYINVMTAEGSVVNWQIKKNRRIHPLFLLNGKLMGRDEQRLALQPGVRYEREFVMGGDLLEKFGAAGDEYLENVISPEAKNNPAAHLFAANQEDNLSTWSIQALSVMSNTIPFENETAFRVSVEGLSPDEFILESPEDQATIRHLAGMYYVKPLRKGNIEIAVYKKGMNPEKIQFRVYRVN